MNLDRLRERVQDFLEEVARERYELSRAPMRTAGLGALHARASDLFSVARIAEVQRAMAESTGLEARRARQLLEFLARGRARQSAASALDERITFETLGSIAAGEGRVPVREVVSVLRATADPELRHGTEEALLRVLADEEPTLHGLLDRKRAVYDELGYGSLIAACELLTEVDLRALVREGERFLDESEAEFRDLIGWFLPRLAGVEIADATEADAIRLEAAAPLAESFSSADTLGGITRLMRQTGLDPMAAGRIQVVRRSDPIDGAAAACRPLEIPARVALLVTPLAGRSAHAETLDALGCALHHGYTSADLPLELRWLGDRSVPLASGVLLRSLLLNPSFLRERYDLPRGRAADYLRVEALLQLFRTRRLVGLMQAAVGWAEDASLNALRDRYVEALNRATGVRHDRRKAVWALELPFEFGWRLRAEQLAAVESGYLRDRFDEDWYRNPHAGAALQDLFASGRRFTATEVAVQLTSAPLSFAPLLARVREAAG